MAVHGCMPSTCLRSIHTDALFSHDLPLRATSEPLGTVIFDWDDTLFPTWYVCNVVVPCFPGGGLTSEEPLPRESPFFAALSEHARTVEKALRAAAATAQVGIVTLGKKYWVKQSANRFLPGLDIVALLKELDIPIVYARECLRASHTCAEQHEGVNLYTIAKTMAMRKMIKKHCSKRCFNGNIISIGDSETERDAVKDLLWSFEEELEGSNPLCKTVKFVRDPSLEQLGAELDLVTGSLQAMLAKCDDFDLSLDDNAEYNH